MIKKILIHNNQKFYVKEIADFHTPYGVIKKEDLKKASTKSSKGKLFRILTPTFPDLWEGMKRGPQVMIQKDIGLILAKTGINHQSKCVDAGGGSGSLCLSLANVAKEVTTYEVNPEHLDVINKNIKLFGIKNLKVKQDSINNLTEKNIDLLTLDLPEPWQVPTDNLKDGGHAVIYLPNLPQVKMFIDATNLKVVETIELIERKWKIEGKIMRPEFQMLGHTGFLVFCRKI